MKTLALIILALFVQLSTAGEIDFPPLVDIAPENINTETDVMAGVDINRCFIPSEESFVHVEGNEITFVFIASYFNPCTLIPIADYYYYNIGNLPEGQYTITFYDAIEGGLPVEPNDPNVTLAQFGEPITFGVGTQAQVPGLSFWGLSMLVMMFVLLGLSILTKND